LTPIIFGNSLSTNSRREIKKDEGTGWELLAESDIAITRLFGNLAK
jgi:hypothetical protein